ncbi:MULTISPECIES: ferritin-like domain-containing protein [Brevibacillus]|uniref:Rubrerythrin n=2 Tax=Brevibacillus TaxID=55080 RepID=A0A1I3LEL6_9BACL|nr:MULTISPECIES: ferritin-like domain-containing protein [Brevibacillus]MDR7314827.1 rubrerythrin [Brevibacillus nitrificans]MEC2131445.1 ferritin-like domain-containing protein [Brevibacillus centrosporus]RNB72530.1 ferritin-like domain-containing protein [Brevibacillus centrosporus]RNB83788.1 ferritin-like domain-containing protein [Brevibacillus nitrificans]SFI83224.1 Rubrerythrin [Brevibacillus centrosporus]
MNGYWYGPYAYASYQPFMQHDDHGQEQERMQTVLRLIQEAIAGERHDELFYDYLLSVAPTEQEKQVITGIRNDERKHNSYFRQIYTQLTGQRPRVSEEGETFQKPASYLDGIEQALMGELKAFEKYRVIYKYIPVQYRDTIFEIMTDEMKHASYYNWLYAKNK